MKWLIRKFKEWRRGPFKRELCRAFEHSQINSKQLHELAARMDSV